MNHDLVTFFERDGDKMKKFTYKIIRGNKNKLLDLIDKHMKKDVKFVKKEENIVNLELLYKDFEDNNDDNFINYDF